MESRDLEPILSIALEEFAEWLQQSDWRGKENDCVNLFAHGFLAKQIRPGSVLHDLTQIGIEIAVSKPPDQGKKPAVRKDLVIWRNPRQTVWSNDYKTALNIPMAIIEWKARNNKMSARDISWLKSFTGAHPECIGVAVLVNPDTVKPEASEILLYAALVREGNVNENWISVPRSNHHKHR
jgi:hypothetical protein